MKTVYEQQYSCPSSLQTYRKIPRKSCTDHNFIGSQALHRLAPKCKLINMHELINKSANDYVTLLLCENGANVNNKG